MNRSKDEGLNGNEKIEQAVYALQQEATQEQLAHTLTVIRRRMKEHGQFVVASLIWAVNRCSSGPSGQPTVQAGGMHSPALRKN